MDSQGQKKLRVLFPFVEAGMGHIMPMTAIADAFEKKYGDQVEIIRTRFFSDTENPGLMNVESELVKEVLLHNKHKYRAVVQNALLHTFRFKTCMKLLYKGRYRNGFVPAIQYIQELKPDLIFNTHFSTAYYSCEARKQGLINADIITYCTDPVIGLQWDYRSDLIGVSSAHGKQKAENSSNFKNTPIVDVPFLIRQQVKDYDKPRGFYKRELSLPEDRFTILLADGAYGAGKLRKTVLELLKSKLPLNIIAVCGKNEKLFNEFCSIKAPDNICFRPYGFTDKMLLLSAACDLFIGKAGSSNLAEPIYFGAPAIVTFCATFIEKWICENQVRNGCAVKITNVKKAVYLAESWAKYPSLMQPYVEACKTQKRCDGPDIMADIIYERLQKGKVESVRFPDPGYSILDKKYI